MASDIERYFRERDANLADWKRADELKLTTDYIVAVDTTIKNYADPKKVNYGLYAETHFFLTKAGNHHILWTDTGVLMGIPSNQKLPVRKTQSK